MNQTSNTTVLAADVGGTKTLIALYQWQDNQCLCIDKRSYTSQNYATFNQLLEEFLQHQSKLVLDAVCIGVAGPIVNGDCQTTNLPWNLKVSEIQQLLNLSAVKLLNDLEATAWGVLDLPEHQWHDLNPHAEIVANKNIAIIAAGTGLGEAVLVATEQGYHAMASEGGHTDFAPSNEQEIELLRYSWQHFPDHVSLERLVSGMGLQHLYQFLKDSHFAPESKEVAQKMKLKDPAAVIGETALLGTDALCSEAVNLFCRLYGAEAGNLALNCLPYSGIYLAGGIGKKLLPALQTGEFLQIFINKGRYSAMLNKMPVRVCLNPEVGLLGAAVYAKKRV